MPKKYYNRICKFFKCKNFFRTENKKKIFCSPSCNIAHRAYRFRCRRCKKLSIGRLCKQCFNTRKGTRVTTIRSYAKKKKMIKIILGAVGSGKTALAVREMALNLNKRKTYSNIQTTLKNQVDISAKMIINREIVDHKKNRKTDESEPVYKYSLNIDFWKNIKEPINVVLDEAHTILNARRAMSKTNIIVSDWIALIRRVLGQTDAGFGELTFISQLSARIDIIARDMATNIIYCICHFFKTCEDCGATWKENSEMPEGYTVCPTCNSNKIQKHTHNIEVWHFPNMPMFQAWHQLGQKTYYKRYIVTNIEKYFPLYNTLQWDNMFSDFY